MSDDQTPERFPSDPILHRLAAVAMALCCFGLYVATLSPGPCPGESSTIIATHLGLRPRLSPANPIWNNLVRPIAAIPGDRVDLGTRLNLLSAVFASAGIFVLFRLLYGLTVAILGRDTLEPVFARRIALLAAFAGSTFLACSKPFWLLATQAHPLTLDVLLLLSCAWVLLDYYHSPRSWKPALFAFFYGVGTVEYSTFIVFAPLFGAGLLMLMHRAESLTPRSFAQLILAAFAGLAFYFAFAWQFFGSDGYHVRGYNGFLHLLWTMWQDQYFELSRSLPRVGWLIILCLTTVPWLTMLAVARWSLNHTKTWDNYLLHAVITALSIVVLFNLKGSPWSLLGTSRLLVVPTLLSALVFAYAVAYWYSVPVTIWWGYTQPRKKWLRPRLGFVLILPLLVSVAVAAALNADIADKAASRLVNRHARNIVQSLAGRQWLISDGMLDNNILIAAHDLAIPLRILNLRFGDNEVYMRFVARMFDDVRLKNLCGIGLMPMLHEWMTTDPDADRKIAVLSLPDLWVSEGFTVVPNLTVFLGSRSRPDTPAEILQAHERFWDANMPAIRDAPGRSELGAAYRGDILRHMSFIANNLGVLMEDFNRDDDAFRCYTRARDMEPANVSALLNQVVMLDRGYKAAEAANVRRDMENILKETSQRHELWKLSRYYGYVRNPLAYAAMGLTWTRSGQPGLAVAGLKKAMELLPEEKRNDVRHRLASVYMGQDMPVQSEQVYRDILSKNPKDSAALVGMARLSIRARDFAKAGEYLKQAETAGAPKTAVAMEWAGIHITAGNPAQARIILQEIVDLKPDSVQAWMLLVDVLTVQRDIPALEQAILKLERIEPRPEIALEIANGSLLLLQNDFSRAAEHFERVLARNPNHYRSVQILIRLDMARGLWDSSFERAAKFLKTHPNDPVANYVMGAFQMKEGDLKLAEDSFRKSLSVAPSFEAANDLAWLLQSRGKLEDAEQLARQAIAIDATMPQPWDTLGVILLKLNRVDEAEKAIEKSLSISQADTRTFLHMAQVKRLKGDTNGVAELVGMLNENRHRLPASDQDALAEMRDSLRLK